MSTTTSTSNITQLLSGSAGARQKFICELLGIEGEIAGEDIEKEIDKLATKRNLLYLTLPATKKFISVEQVDTFLEFASKRPHLSAEAIAIINPAEKMSLDAQNKILKLVEEPPQYLQIYLLADEPDSVIATIRSRCELKYLAEELGSSEDEAEFEELAKKFLHDSFSSKDAYKELDATLTKLKTGPERNRYLEKLLVSLGKVHSQECESKFGAGIPNAATLEQAQRLQKLLRTLGQSIRFNVNPKLIADRLFLELQTML